jgi:hypothetical protein
MGDALVSPRSEGAASRLRRLSFMPIIRVRCARCGLDATCVRSALGDVTSVNPDMFAALCEAAAAARLQGEPASPREVSCPDLRASSFPIAANAEAEDAARQSSPPA